jgi:hypothetical protein
MQFESALILIPASRQKSSELFVSQDDGFFNPLRVIQSPNDFFTTLDDLMDNAKILSAPP